jgi:hypothetical protein
LGGKGEAAEGLNGDVGCLPRCLSGEVFSHVGLGPARLVRVV